MTPTTELQPLSHRNRRIVFSALVLIFILSVPLMVFYAIGYRFDLTDTTKNIKSVGGMYISSEIDTVDMYVDDTLVEDMRIFRAAAYIQNLEEGVHALHVQGDGVQTWVKNLPVFPHFVTEAQSFNMPKVPQVRIIPQWITSTGEGVLFELATSTMFSFASSTDIYTFSTSTATSSYTESLEYLYIEDLFASSTQLRKSLQAEKDSENKRFDFGPLIPVPASSTATSTKIVDDFALYEDEEDVFVKWQGTTKDIPYYFCVRYLGKEETIDSYGAHIFDALQTQFGIQESLDKGISIGQRLCRDAIRIDRLQQEIQWFDFYPRGTDIVLMQLEDGLYAIEIDDRAWQNTQLIYPGADFHVVLDGGRLYIQDRGYFLEVFTEIAAQ